MGIERLTRLRELILCNDFNYFICVVFFLEFIELNLRGSDNRTYSSALRQPEKDLTW